MDLLLIRHAHAYEREEWFEQDYPDSLRPLSKKGKQKFQKASKNLSKMIHKIDTIYSSQYTRCLESAEILKTYYPNAHLEITSRLNPNENYRKNAEFLKNHKNDDTVVFIGHQPELGSWALNLLSDKSGPYIRIKKGGALLIRDYEDSTRQLQWLLTCNQLAGV